MELRHLYSFVQVAETGSFSDAAVRCCLTQSAVSQHVKALEHEFGCLLMLRNSHHVSLTESGQALLAKAKGIIKMAEETREHMATINGTIQGELRIGVGSFVEPVIRMATMRMMKLYPDVRLNIEFGKACRLNKMLREHSIDLAFSMNTALPHEGIESQPLIPFSICAVMPKTHILAKHKSVTYDDIVKHNVVVPDVGERVFSTFQQYLNVDLSLLKVRMIVSSPHAALTVTSENNLITFLPKMYVDRMPNLVAIPIEGFDKGLVSKAHWMADMPLKRSAQELIRLIREEAVPCYKAME